jgi:2-succinyl-5-enolpyruvyl-6-hydroxy-3-cyclohexene-1-carboxylate synthase
MGNLELAQQLIAGLAARGVREFCVCAGSRNSPLLAVLGASSFRLFSFVDERAAAFFALGRMKLHGAPVAVVTTSGTAVAELLPATIEAYYSGLPLVLVSADRPARFRGTAAPQCIEQEGLFGQYAAVDLAGWAGTRPLHLNIEFDEPLIDGPLGPMGQMGPIGPMKSSHASHESHRSHLSHRSHRLSLHHPLVIIGGLPPHHRERVRAFVQQLNAPTYAEPLSGLREDPALPTLKSGERILHRARFDSVIRIGHVPTLRFWRDLEESRSSVPVTHFSDLPFTGLTRGELHPIDALAEPEPLERDDRLFAEDAQKAAAFAALLDEHPQSELSLLRQTSRNLPPGARIYLGNSLPIREWDLVATRDIPDWTYEANRGANGIDGQLSTFLGQCHPARPNVAILGDLTTIYDSNAPWIVPQLDDSDWRLVIVNNGGGRIFSRVPSLRRLDPSFREKIIENHHHFRFGPWAESWNIAARVTELQPDEEATARVWKRYDDLWA